MLTLASDTGSCRIAPVTGGSLASWDVAGQPMLRRAATGAGALGSASFPLVPYSNRIESARFNWNGRTVAVPTHPIAMPHSLHGTGWESCWEAVDVKADSAVLTLEHNGDARWPWPFMAVQQIELGADCLKLTLSATNLADEAVPLAFGHHPYFDAAGATLTFNADAFYTAFADCLPKNPVAPEGIFDFSNGRTIDGTAIDTIYGGWDGVARIDWMGRDRALEIRSSLPHAVLYTPPGEDYFCFEPVPHISNALNRADGDMPVIAPGESFEAWIALRAVA